MRGPGDIVQRYYEVVADLASTADELLALLHPDVRIVEHPNTISPRGSVRDRDAAVAGFLAGKKLLAAQSFDLHELLVSGQRVAVRTTWRGTIAHGSPALPGASELVAHIAGFVTVEDGMVLAHETFDCYEPLPRAAAS
jgi:ketosteroid isomerase-like protein